MKMTYLIIGLLIIGGLVFYLTSCKSKSVENSSEQTVIKNDSIKKVPQQFIDLLFAEQTIKEINKTSSGQPTDPNSVWGKFQAVEKLESENKTDEAKKILKEIANDKHSEARTIVWAWNGLRELGETSTTPKVLGLILEVPQQNTTEYLAMYSDGTARYINYTGSVAVWETHDNEMDKLLLDITSKAQKFVEKEKLSNGRNKSITDKVRFNFLTTSGILQIEKTFDELTGQQTDIGEIFMTSTQVLTLIVNSGVKK